MSFQTVLLLLAGAGVGGIAIGYFLRMLILLGQRGSMELRIRKMMLDAEEQAKKITEEAGERAQAREREIATELKERERELKTTEDRLVRREELLDKRQINLDTDAESMAKKQEETQLSKQQAEELLKQRQVELEKISELSADEAKKELIGSVEKQYEQDLEGRMRKLEISSNERLEQKAREILTTAVHRLGNSVVADVLATTISLPSDEIKGKIIGKEGRNIRSFERATGVDVIIDDTPGTI